jgi:hypothetical protein
VNSTLEQILLFAGLFFASLYFVILFVWISGIDERDRIAIGIRRGDSDGN